MQVSRSLAGAVCGSARSYFRGNSDSAAGYFSLLHLPRFISQTAAVKWCFYKATVIPHNVRPAAWRSRWCMRASANGLLASIHLTFSQSSLTWFSVSCLHSFSCSIHPSSSLVKYLSSMSGLSSAFWADHFFLIPQGTVTFGVTLLRAGCQA